MCFFGHRLWNMTLRKDLQELLEAGVIAPETATAISQYYSKNKPPKEQRLLLIFGILGALLVGLGILLVLAHNWDSLPRWFKTCLAFLPLVSAQGLCAFSMLKRPDSKAWKEGSATFLFVSIGIAMALISQIYHIDGNLEGYLLTWMLLALPSIYILRSSMAAMLYIIGISDYLLETHSLLGSWHGNNYYWPLLIGVLPYYALQCKRHFVSNFTKVMHWLVLLSIVLWTFWVPGNDYYVRTLATFGIFAVFQLVGNSPPFVRLRKAANAYTIAGTIGIVALLLLFGFQDVWPSPTKIFVSSTEYLGPFLLALILIVAVTALLLVVKYRKGMKAFHPLDWSFPAFAVIMLMAYWVGSGLGAVLCNVAVFVLGLYYVFTGSKNNRLDQINFGLLIISLLTTFRFFDTDLSFLLRGAIFIAVGLSFFVSNYRILKKRRAHAE